ncbi:glycerol kinase GlpK [Asticcacaulis solisilvae]|uniref:glycerol kinase GlpK n=1 Tax=Asticcacaulis solisilvae TaxID=1217274 RepID=UPI003FD87C97
MKSHILALDQGTTSSRAIVFDAAGAVKAVAQKPFNQIFPEPGRVEHDANEIWSTQIGVSQEAIAAAGLVAGDIAAIGIANQRETTVVWERATGKPIHNAIVWQDRRTAGMCDDLRAAGYEDTFRKKTGLLLDPYFSGTKLAWILDHVDGARARAERGDLAFGTVDCWLLNRLSGGELHVTDASNASRTLMFDIHTGQWDDELLRILNIPRALLPVVRGNSEIYGETAQGLFGARIAIAGMAGDQQAATFGQACLEPGMAKNTYGTGCFLLMNTGSEAKESRNRLLTTLAWQVDGKRTYALEGSVFVAGAAVQWLRDGLGIIRSSDEVGPLAASVPDTGGVVFVPAFTGLGAPQWDAYARGTIVGLTRGTTKAHIARAVLEAIACQSAELLDAMRADSGVACHELRVDGGAASNDLLMQIQADLLGVPVVRPRVTETTALGAACLAGLATGVWTSADDLRGQWRVDRVFEPAISADARESRLALWRKAVSRSQNWADA